MTVGLSWQKRQRLTHATVKGEPVAGTGKRNRRKGGFNRTRAGRNSGLYGALSGLRTGCTCCDYYGPKERRQIRRQERTQWRAQWADEQRSELEKLFMFASWE